jgi:hypothetical protein
MNVREYRPSDLEELKRIHGEFYRDEFELPEFLRNYLCAVTIEDDKGIVTVGGVRDIAEVVAVTDKSRSTRARYKALWELYHASAYFAKVESHSQLHAFIQEEKWLKHLLNVGFRYTKGTGLVMEI